MGLSVVEVQGIKRMPVAVIVLGKREHRTCVAHLSSELNMILIV